MLQGGDPEPHCSYGLFGQCQVAAIAVQFAFEAKLDKPVEIRLKAQCQSNLEVHLRFLAIRARATKLACTRRCSTLARTEVSTSSHEVSHTAGTAST